MTIVDPAPAEQLLSELYKTGAATHWHRAVLAEMLSPGVLHPRRADFPRIEQLSWKLTRIGYTVVEPPPGPSGGRRAVITAYAPLTPLQLATLALIDAMYCNPEWPTRFGHLGIEDYRAGGAADWAAGATSAELGVATLLAPTFPGPWADLVAVAEATCAAPTQRETQ